MEVDTDARGDAIFEAKANEILKKVGTFKASYTRSLRPHALVASGLTH